MIMFLAGSATKDDLPEEHILGSPLEWGLMLTFYDIREAKGCTKYREERMFDQNVVLLDKRKAQKPKKRKRKSLL